MSLSSTNDSASKADQIAHKFFTKFALLLHNARSTPHAPGPKLDKWFNLETPDTDQFRDHLRLYRTLSASADLPPFELQILLSVPELATNQVLVLSDATATRARVEPAPSHVLLESWVVVFSPGRPYDDDRPDVALSSVYKQSISVFRSMFTLLRVLPAWKLFRRLRRPEATHLGIQVRVADPANEVRMLKFGAPLSASASSSLPTSSHAFPPVAHPLGTLSISTTYLLSPLFHIDTLESLLSSRFLSQDDESFTPTLAARASQPRSASIADRFVLPQPSLLRGPPPARVGSASRQSGSGGSGSGGSRPVSMLGSRPVSTLPRADSPTGSGSPKFGPAALPLPDSPVPAPLPIRRPSINAIHPFKSATLSSGSPSLHSGASSSMRHSPLSAAGPSLPSRPPLTASPSARPPISPSPSARPTYPPPPPSPMNVLAPTRPSPPAPSERPAGKRYSSSFANRYAATGGAGSDGSPGKRSDERDRPGSASFLSTTTDDDDISAFVQAIDVRAPLSIKPAGGVAREQSEDTEMGAVESPRGDEPEPARGQEESRVARDEQATGREETAAGREDADGPDETVGEPGADAGPPRKYRDHVDSELKRMNDAFVQSLAGLEGRPRRRTRPSLDTGRRLSSDSGRGPPESPRAPDSPLGAGRALPDSPLSAGRAFPDSPLSAGRALPDSPARGSPLRPSLTLSGSGSASGSATHRRTGSTASGSDEIMGRLEFDERPGSAGGRPSSRGSGGGYARTYR